MSSNQLMGYEGGTLPLSGAVCLCRRSGRRTEPACAGCGPWPKRTGGLTSDEQIIGVLA